MPAAVNEHSTGENEAVTSLVSQLYSSGRPVVLAHRGGLAEFPENSRAAMEGMLAAGVRVMETDVRHTLDGVPVLAHDVTLQRRFGDPRDVSSITWNELSRLRDHDGAALLALEEALVDFPGVVLNIDAKTDEVVTPMLRLVRSVGAQDRVCLTAFSSRRVARIARITRGQAMIGMGMAEVARLLAWASVPSRAATTAPRPWEPSEARAVQVPRTFRGLPVVTPRFLAGAHSAGHVVHVWTVNEPAEMDRLLDLGVDGIVTDVPSIAMDVFRRRGIVAA